MNDEDIVICYDGLDREDNMGTRIEKSTIVYKNITKLEYSKPLQCLNIQGFLIESIQYLKQPSKKEFIKNYFDKKEEKRTLLYVSGKEREKIISVLEQKTGKKVIQLD